MSLTAAQLDTRRKGIGSSDIAAILDEDPWKSPIDVWCDKTGRGPVEVNADATRYGHRAEILIADEFSERKGLKLEVWSTVVLHENPIALATPDRKIAGSSPLVIVECKNVGWRVLPRWRRDGDTYRAPTYVFLQGQWQCGVTGAAGFHVAAWLGGRDWYDEYFPADQELFGHMLTVADRWWRDHVVNDAQPAPGDTERARQTLERLWPAARKKLIQAPAVASQMAQEYAAARAEERDARKRKLAAGNQLCALIGDAEGFTADWGQVTWRASGKGSTSWAAVAKELQAPADLVAKHTKPPKRVLKVKVQGLEDDDDDE